MNIFYRTTCTITLITLKSYQFFIHSYERQNRSTLLELQDAHRMNLSELNLKCFNVEFKVFGSQSFINSLQELGRGNRPNYCLLKPRYNCLFLLSQEVTQYASHVERRLKLLNQYSDCSSYTWLCKSVPAMSSMSIRTMNRSNQ